MKTLVLSIISLFTVSLWSFANEDGIKAQVPNHANNESIIYSSNTNVNDYSKREFSPEGIIMPRMGEYYEGAISYNNVSFPLYIYWDLEIEGYNLYAYIQGSSTSIDGYHHTMSHIATRNSECSNSRFDFIITVITPIVIILDFGKNIVISHFMSRFTPQHAVVLLKS